MRHASLFSGIGGFDLAADWMGWENIFHCDINPFGKKVLEYYYPNSISYGDITKTDFTIHKGDIDILTGGFPCQPYSHAGKRKGKEDQRHLWPQMLRAIREISPRWVVGENVYGLVNWNGALVFHEVQSDLEAEGYEVFPYVLPACSINAPHRRDRVFFIAYSNDIRCNECNGEYAKQSINGRLDALNDISKMSSQESSTDSECERLYRRNKTWKENNINRENSKLWGSSSRYDKKNNGDASDTNGIGGRQNEWFGNGESNVIYKNGQTTNWQNFPTVSPICNGDDGISDRLDSITFSKWRNESIKAGGNAVVPQLIYILFKTISKFEELKTKQC